MDMPFVLSIASPSGPMDALCILPQIWLLALLVYMARASAVMRLGIAAGCAIVTAVALPPRLWKAQLRRLGLLALLLFVVTAIGSGQYLLNC